MQRYFEINENGHNIRCKLYYTDIRSIRKIVLFCHGFGGHKDNSAAQKFAERMLSKTKGMALVTFNWPAHGDDVKKKLSLEDCSTYLELTVRHLEQTYQTRELYAYATSFGGYLALKYIAEKGNPFRRIALRCPAVNMYDVLTRTIISADELEKLRKGKDIPVGFDRKVLITARFLKELQEADIRHYDYLDYAEDILILQGTRDEIVPYDDVRAFAEDNLIEFLSVPGADHRFRTQESMEQAIKLILGFFQNAPQ